MYSKKKWNERLQNMSNKEKTALRILQRNKNIDVVMNDTDYALKRISLFNILRLSAIVIKHTLKGVCSNKEAVFLLSNLNKFKIPHFYRIWKILKNPIVQTHRGWVQGGTYFSLSIRWTLLKRFLQQVCLNFNGQAWCS